MRIDHFTFERRPLSDLPTHGDLISWLVDFGGDDQWVVSGDCEELPAIGWNNLC